MENFKRENNGYATRDVDNFLQKMRAEYNEKIRRQNEKMQAMSQEMNDMKYSLDMYKERERQISKALVKAIQKADDITTSARTVYDLEIKRVQLLYKKWENVLDELRSKFAGLLSGEELENLVGDFQYALTITLNSQLNERGERVYSKSVLEKMQHRANPLDAMKTLQKNEMTVTYDKVGTPVSMVAKQQNDSGELTLAEKYLNGEDIEMPKSYGEINPNSFMQLPPIEYLNALQQSSGFSINDALHPQESLKEILSAFDLGGDDDE